MKYVEKGIMRMRLLEIIKEKSLQTNVDRVLTSGRKSTYYIDAKMTTLDPEGAKLVGHMILDILKPYRPLPAFIVRKEPKKHGERKMIEGPFQQGWKVAIVDDIVTTAGSTLKAIEAVEEEGGNVALSLTIVDRLEGGRENLEKSGYKFISLFTRKDLLGE